MKEVARHIVMHPDCNATENLFGGRLLAWIDEAAAMYAICQTKSQNVVTAHFGGLDFKVPTPIGSIVRLYAETIKQGNKSITVSVTAVMTDFEMNTETEIASTELVLVKVNSLGVPQVINW